MSTDSRRAGQPINRMYDVMTALVVLSTALVSGVFLARTGEVLAASASALCALGALAVLVTASVRARLLAMGELDMLGLSLAVAAVGIPIATTTTGLNVTAGYVMVALGLAGAGWAALQAWTRKRPARVDASA